MSVEGQVLGASTVAGGTAAVASGLTNTGNPILVGLIIGIVVVVVLGLIARVTMSR